MKIKITQCSLPNSWYKNKIGKTFEVETAGPKCVEVKKKNNNRNIHFYVLDCDYIIIKERFTHYKQPEFFNSFWNPEDPYGQQGRSFGRFVGGSVHGNRGESRVDWYYFD
jgi:hypothetical protein